MGRKKKKKSKTPGSNNRNAKPRTALDVLIAAVREGDVEAVRVAATAMGADVNQTEQNGCTPLYIAAQQGHLEVVRALVTELGAYVNQATQVGTTLVYCGWKR